MVNKPLGGKLVNRVVSGKERDRLINESKEMPNLQVDKDSILDIENIALGVFSPLQGFLLREDYNSVVHNKSLSNGTPWTIPIILQVSKDEAEKLKEGEDIALVNGDNTPVSILHLEEKHVYNKHELVNNVFGTTDEKHPGVKKIIDGGDVILGGNVDLLNSPNPVSKEYFPTPNETREIFEKRKWKTIAGFQTRNVPHRAHEYLQKIALEVVDGVFIHPLIGWKKKGDFGPDIIIKCYNELIEHYYPKDRVVFGVLTTAMRYAGPREAVFHALIRKNYGCTHFIVGRDHAGVGNYYGKYDAHKIFDEIGDVGIEILRLNGPYYCKKCGSIVTEKTCHHPIKDQIEISGTNIRKMLEENKKIPEELMRPEVSKLLHENI